MTARLHFTEASIRRAVHAARKAGLDVSAVSIAPDGTVTIHSGLASANPPSENREQSKWLDVEA
jgi:hypothetical protein